MHKNAIKRAGRVIFWKKSNYKKPETQPEPVMSNPNPTRTRRNISKPDPTRTRNFFQNPNPTRTRHLATRPITTLTELALCIPKSTLALNFIYKDTIISHVYYCILKQNIVYRTFISHLQYF